MEVVLLCSVGQLLLNPEEGEALFTGTFETSAAHLSYSRARSLTLPWIRQPVMGRDSLGLHPGCLWSPCPAHPPSFVSCWNSCGPFLGVSCPGLSSSTPSAVWSSDIWSP